MSASNLPETVEQAIQVIERIIQERNDFRNILYATQTSLVKCNERFWNTNIALSKAKQQIEDLRRLLENEDFGPYQYGICPFCERAVGHTPTCDYSTTLLKWGITPK